MNKPPQQSNSRLPKQRIGLQLGIEQLEPRLLMNADNNAMSPVTSSLVTSNVVAAVDVASTPVVFQPLLTWSISTTPVGPTNLGKTPQSKPRT